MSAFGVAVTVELGLRVAVDYPVLPASAPTWLIVPVMGPRMTLDAGTALAQSGVQEVDSPTKTRTATYP